MHVLDSQRIEDVFFQIFTEAFSCQDLHKGRQDIMALPIVEMSAGIKGAGYLARQFRVFLQIVFPFLHQLFRADAQFMTGGLRTVPVHSHTAGHVEKLSDEDRAFRGTDEEFAFAVTVIDLPVCKFRDVVFHRIRQEEQAFFIKLHGSSDRDAFGHGRHLADGIRGKRYLVFRVAVSDIPLIQAVCALINTQSSAGRGRAVLFNKLFQQRVQILKCTHMKTPF